MNINNKSALLKKSNYYISNVLIDWFQKNKRDLPWRETTDPYLIWLSEIILQQTRVNQGLSYFREFEKRFPNVQSLAAATEDEVLKLWQGLGYYSRARNLHQTAKDVVLRFNGIFPRDYNDILSLKGVGEYTAAAIASFAFELPYATVDGNVFRVLSRLFSVETPIDSSKGKKVFSDLAHQLMNPSQAGMHNQAIMEFGALQCTPQSPNCAHCPLNEQCLAFSQGRVIAFPVKQGKTKTRSRYFNYFHIIENDHIYLKKRTGNDIWKNLYEFPLIETASQLSTEEIMSLPDFKRLFSGEHDNGFLHLADKQKHILSHQTIYATFYLVANAGKSNLSMSGEYLKIPIHELHKYPISRLIHKYLENFVNDL